MSDWGGARLRVGFYSVWDAFHSFTKPVIASATMGPGYSENKEKWIYQIIYYHVKHSAANEQI